MQRRALTICFSPLASYPVSVHHTKAPPRGLCNISANFSLLAKVAHLIFIPTDYMKHLKDSELLDLLERNL